LVAAAKFLVAATKKIFVVPNFVAVTKPFFFRAASFDRRLRQIPAVFRPIKGWTVIFGLKFLYSFWTKQSTFSSFMRWRQRTDYPGIPACYLFLSWGLLILCFFLLNHWETPRRAT